MFQRPKTRFTAVAREDLTAGDVVVKKGTVLDVYGLQVRIPQSGRLVNVEATELRKLDIEATDQPGVRPTGR